MNGLAKIYHGVENLIVEHVGTEKHQLEKFYNALDWVDFGLVVYIIARFAGWEPDLPWLDMMFYLTSLFTCSFAFVTSSMLRKRGWISKGRFIFRLFWWPIWIPVDLIFIVLSVISLFNS